MIRELKDWKRAYELAKDFFHSQRGGESFKGQDVLDRLLVIEHWLADAEKHEAECVERCLGKR